MSVFQNFIDKVVQFEDLTEDEAIRAFQIIMKGGATNAQIAALLIGLRMKGESIGEITGAAKVMRAKAVKFNAPDGALDTCGTGGDGSGSYNISTAVAFVVAGCGVPVAKHGNKAVSSRSGSADVLMELGVNIEADKSIMERALVEANVGFMMAPRFHNAMRYVAPIRQELGIRTIFNVLGPLSNPAGAKFQLLGVYSKKLVEPLANVLKNLGVEAAWVVHGADGMDELTVTKKSYVAELKNGNVKTFEVKPSDAGLKRYSAEDLEGGDCYVNAQALKHVIAGRGVDAYTDIVLLNSAACLVVAGKAADLKEGVAIAREAIESGKANEALLKLVEVSNDFMPQQF